MLKSISNIAWSNQDDEWMFNELKRRNWNAIEIAPSRIWEDFRNVSKGEREEYLNKVKGYDLKICSLHSLFFGVEGADLFGTKEEQQFLQQYLISLIDLASDLEAGVLVLGSPKVRNPKSFSKEEAMDIAAEALRGPAAYASEKSIKILIEPLMKIETNFINTHKEGIELVDKIGNIGFGLHLDEKSIVDEEDSIEDIISTCGEEIVHFHINEAGLTEITDIGQHHQVARILKSINYSHYVSIEMKMTDRETILKCLDYVDSLF